MESQRSCTQLGRAYLDFFLARSSGECAQQRAAERALGPAKEYLQLSLRLAAKLRDGKIAPRHRGNGRRQPDPGDEEDSKVYARALADAYNNVGLLFHDLEDPEEAIKSFERGLEVTACSIKQKFCCCGGQAWPLLVAVPRLCIPHSTIKHHNFHVLVSSKCM